MTNSLELVLRLSGGAVRVPLKRVAAILGIEPHTIRNRRALGTFPIASLPEANGGRVYFDVREIAAYLDKQATAPVRRGTSSLAEREAAGRLGMTVQQMRTQAAGAAQNG